MHTPPPSHLLTPLLSLPPPRRFSSPSSLPTVITADGHHCRPPPFPFPPSISLATAAALASTRTRCRPLSLLMPPSASPPPSTLSSSPPPSPRLLLAVRSPSTLAACRCLRTAAHTQHPRAAVRFCISNVAAAALNGDDLTLAPSSHARCQRFPRPALAAARAPDRSCASSKAVAPSVPARAPPVIALHLTTSTDRRRPPRCS